MLKVVPLTPKPKGFKTRSDSKADIMMLCIDPVGCTLYRGKGNKIIRKIGRYKKTKIGLDKLLMHDIDEKNKHLDKVLGNGGQYQVCNNITIPYHPNPHQAKLSTMFTEIGAIVNNGLLTSFDGASEGIS